MKYLLALLILVGCVDPNTKDEHNTLNCEQLGTAYSSGIQKVSRCDFGNKSCLIFVGLYHGEVQSVVCERKSVIFRIVPDKEEK